MIKKSFSIITVLAIAILSFFIGLLANKLISPAALSIPFLTNVTPPIHTCVDQKCVAVSNQCSSDSNCETHMQCNSQEQCVSVSGAGSNQCSVNSDCSPDPQKWCQSHNPGTGLTVTAIKYPNGNFSCDCEYNVGGIISQAPCSNNHLNQ